MSEKNIFRIRNNTGSICKKGQYSDTIDKFFMSTSRIPTEIPLGMSAQIITSIFNGFCDCCRNNSRYFFRDFSKFFLKLPKKY